MERHIPWEFLQSVDEEGPCLGDLLSLDQEHRLLKIVQTLVGRWLQNLRVPRDSIDFGVDAVALQEVLKRELIDLDDIDVFSLVSQGEDESVLAFVLLNEEIPF